MGFTTTTNSKLKHSAEETLTQRKNLLRDNYRLCIFVFFFLEIRLESSSMMVAVHGLQPAKAEVSTSTPTA